MNCPTDHSTEDNLCPYWDLSKNKKFKAKVSNLINENKFLLVKLQPVIKDGVVEGQDKYEVPFNFDYTYEVRHNEVKISKYDGSQDVTVNCNPKTNSCN